MYVLNSKLKHEKERENIRSVKSLEVCIYRGTASEKSFFNVILQYAVYTQFGFKNIPLHVYSHTSSE